MQAKKATKKKPKNARDSSNGNCRSRDDSVLPLYMVEASYPFPVRLNPESAEEREKRIAKRKARTLRIFQTAYENHRNKDS